LLLLLLLMMMISTQLLHLDPASPLQSAAQFATVWFPSHASLHLKPYDLYTVAGRDSCNESWVGVARHDSNVNTNQYATHSVAKAAR